MSLIQDQQDLVRWVRNEKEHLEIAVAFWGSGAVEQLGLDDANKSYRILLDLTSGGSNPKVVAQLLKLRPKLVRCVDRLHAKAFIGKSEVLIGSANASANGLGEEGSEATHWRELGLSSKSRKDIVAAQAWFEGLWEDSREITQKMLACAREKWEKRQKARPLHVSASKDLLEAASANPDAFKNRNIFISVSTEKLSARAEKVRVKKAKETKAPAHMFENWPTMPVDAHLICFTDFNGKTISKDGPGIYHTRVDRQRGPYFWIDESNIEGFEFGRIPPWRRSLERARAANPRRWDSTYGFIMDFGEFAEKYSE